MIVITFNAPGDFEAYNQAEEWCRDRGISVGSMQRDQPIGIKIGEYTILKWRDLNDRDKSQLDGQIIGQNKRNGPITIEIKEEVFAKIRKINDQN